MKVKLKVGLCGENVYGLVGFLGEGCGGWRCLWVERDGGTVMGTYRGHGDMGIWDRDGSGACGIWDGRRGYGVMDL